MKFISATLFFIVLTAALDLSAQTAEPGAIQKTNKSFVSVPVSVSDREGHYIPGLKKEDFRVYQDGVEQKITFFATYDEPLSVALLLDTSVSTKDTLGKIKDAAADFIELLNPSDRCLIATFDSQVNVLSPLTADQRTLKSSLDKIKTATEEGTVVYRAVEQIARQSFGNAPGRKAIVLLSDGKDFGSSVTGAALLNQLEESDVLVYTVFYKTGAGGKPILDSSGAIKQTKTADRAPQKNQPKKKKAYTIFIPAPAGLPSVEEIEFLEKTADLEAVNFLKEMSDVTAGRFYLSDAPKLNRIFKTIAGELRQQYRLGFRSKDAADDAATRNVSVKVGRSDAVVRARGKFRAKQL